jgi:hypothetical protein
MNKDNSESTYSFEQKEKLARRIQKLKKEKHFFDIQDIITKHNPDINITTNPSGHFMYFQNLRFETYYAIEKYIKKVTMGQFLSETSETYSTQNTQSDSRKTYLSDSVSETPKNKDSLIDDIKKYSSEDEPFSTNPKLKYSNREKNLIKRKNYDKQINGSLCDNISLESNVSILSDNTEKITTNNDNILQDSDCYKTLSVEINKDESDSANNNLNILPQIRQYCTDSSTSVDITDIKQTEKIFVKRKRNIKGVKNDIHEKDVDMTLS